MAQNDGRDFAVEGNDLSGYVGVSPEYMNYANETEAPLRGDDDEVQAAVADHDALVAGEPQAPSEVYGEAEDEDEATEPEPEPEPEQPKRTAPPA